MGSRRKALVAALAVSSLLSGCAVGPRYERPTTALPGAFIEKGPWKDATPRDHLPKGRWWAIYQDGTLEQWVERANEASPTLQAAVARRDQAWALARMDRANLFPSLSVNPSADRGRGQTRNASTGSRTDNAFSLPANLSYELDLWGRVRKLAESGRALAEASEADYHNALLSVQADVVISYFSLRSLEVEHTLLTRTVESRRRSLDIVKRRFQLGASGDYEVSLAETELATAESDLLANERERAAYKVMVAVLCGALPESFIPVVSADPLPLPPTIPLALPSELLERRPDVASAERTLAASHAQIGVAKAAYFPSINLLGSAGFASGELSDLLRWDSRIWSIGSAISLPIFQGGRLRANVDRAQAVYQEAFAGYRQSVLVAFRDVETALSDLRTLSDQSEVLDRAVASSQRASELVGVRYRSGQIGYLDVTAAERTAIANERLALQVREQQLIASVQLIRALGGGW
ncbi:MAG TPA: efflux transporter outer membrane subunit [Opitutaceae bacterium]|nr:efflux transporter outer membrane subunit [Opitutaceae bacterium]